MEGRSKSQITNFFFHPQGSESATESLINDNLVFLQIDGEDVRMARLRYREEIIQLHKKFPMRDDEIYATVQRADPSEIGVRHVKNLLGYLHQIKQVPLIIAGAYARGLSEGGGMEGSFHTKLFGFEDVQLEPIARILLHPVMGYHYACYLGQKQNYSEETFYLLSEYEKLFGTQKCRLMLNKWYFPGYFPCPHPCMQGDIKKAYKEKLPTFPDWTLQQYVHHSMFDKFSIADEAINRVLADPSKKWILINVIAACSDLQDKRLIQERFEVAEKLHQIQKERAAAYYQLLSRATSKTASEPSDPADMPDHQSHTMSY